MALIVEDGTGVANANSYVSVGDAQAYAEARGKLELVADDDAVEQALVRAMDFLEIVPDYLGYPYADYALSWPRTRTYLFKDDQIPKALRSAEIEIALAILSGIDPMPNSAGEDGIKREKVGPIETEYTKGDGYIRLPYVTQLLNTVRSSFSGRLTTIRV